MCIRDRAAEKRLGRAGRACDAGGMSLAPYGRVLADTRLRLTLLLGVLSLIHI